MNLWETARSTECGTEVDLSNILLRVTGGVSGRAGGAAIDFVIDYVGVTVVALIGDEVRRQIRMAITDTESS